MSLAGPDSSPAPACLAEALASIEAGLDYINGEDVPGLPIAVQADALRTWSRLDAKRTAAEAALVSAFDATEGYAADGQSSTSSWLTFFTRCTATAARHIVAGARRLRGHLHVARALAAGTISASTGKLIIDFCAKLPGEDQEAAERVLTDVAAAGADTADLSLLATEIYRRVYPNGIERDEDRAAADRGLTLGKTFGGAGRLNADLTARATSLAEQVIGALAGRKGPEDTRTPRQRRHDAFLEALSLLAGSNLMPERGGAKPQVKVDIPLAALRRLPGADDAVNQWIRLKAAQLAVHPSLDPIAAESASAESAFTEPASAGYASVGSAFTGSVAAGLGSAASGSAGSAFTESAPAESLSAGSVFTSSVAAGSGSAASALAGSAFTGSAFTEPASARPTPAGPGSAESGLAGSASAGSASAGSAFTGSALAGSGSAASGSAGSALTESAPAESVAAGFGGGGSGVARGSTARCGDSHAPSQSEWTAADSGNRSHGDVLDAVAAADLQGAWATGSGGITSEPSCPADAVGCTATDSNDLTEDAPGAGDDSGDVGLHLAGRVDGGAGGVLGAGLGDSGDVVSDPVGLADGGACDTAGTDHVCGSHPHGDDMRAAAKRWVAPVSNGPERGGAETPGDEGVQVGGPEPPPPPPRGSPADSVPAPDSLTGAGLPPAFAGPPATLGAAGPVSDRTAAALACDALIMPSVTGAVDQQALAGMTDDWLRAHGLAGCDTASCDCRRPLAPATRHRLGETLLRWAVEVLSGPGGLASYLRTGQFAGPLAGPSIVLDVGRPTKTVPAHLEQAVRRRDRHCRWPGCDRAAELSQVHHITPRAAGGLTRIDNLLTLCDFHHLIAVHTWGWTVRLGGDGTTTATSPGGRTLRESGSAATGPPHPQAA